MKRVLVVILVATLLPLTLLFVGCSDGQAGSVSYEITAEYLPESRTLFATQKVAYEHASDGVKDRLLFELYPNAYRKEAVYKPISTAYQSAAYYAGESFGEMSITSVVGGKGWEVCGEDENILAVDLETPLYAGDKVVLDISFILTLAKVDHRTGVSQGGVNLGNFYPILCADLGRGFVENRYHSIGDPFVSNCADYTVRLTLPKEYAVASSGAIVEERALESKKQCLITLKNARDFALVLSKDFDVVEEKIGKTTIQYYHLSDRKAGEKLTLICDSIRYFSSIFGEYPYDTYSVVQTGFCFGGMEYPGLVYISSSLSERESQHTIVHETAHQWWYAAVGSDQVQEAWQDEGLTEYSTLLFFEKNPKYGVDKKTLLEGSIRACRAYKEVYGNLLGDMEGRMSRPLDEYLSEYAYRVLAYDKGVVLFDTLRGSVGDKKFFAALRKYYALGKFKIASVGTLVGAFEKTGVDVKGHFDAFLQGKVTI